MPAGRLHAATRSRRCSPPAAAPPGRPSPPPSATTCGPRRPTWPRWPTSSTTPSTAPAPTSPTASTSGPPSTTPCPCPSAPRPPTHVVPRSATARPPRPLAVPFPLQRGPQAVARLLRHRLRRPRRGGGFAEISSNGAPTPARDRGHPLDHPRRPHPRLQRLRHRRSHPGGPPHLIPPGSARRPPIDQTGAVGSCRGQGEEAAAAPVQGAQVRGAEHVPRPRPDRQRPLRARVALRALGRPSSQQGARPLRLLLLALLGLKQKP